MGSGCVLNVWCIWSQSESWLQWGSCIYNGDRIRTEDFLVPTSSVNLYEWYFSSYESHTSPCFAHLSLLPPPFPGVNLIFLGNCFRSSGSTATLHSSKCTCSHLHPLRKPTHTKKCENENSATLGEKKPAELCTRKPYISAWMRKIKSDVRY